jgi:hypothetical protein
MNVENSADRLAMLSDFGQTVSIDGSDVTAIYDEDYVESLDIAGTRPLLYCRTSDVESAGHGDSVEVDGIDYTVAKVQPDGTGLTVLILEED